MIIPTFIHVYTVVECPPLSLSNGIVTETGNNPGDIANYNCSVNFTLVGSDIRTCEASGNNNGSWSGSDPECFSKYDGEIFFSHSFYFTLCCVLFQWIVRLTLMVSTSLVPRIIQR